MRVLIVGAGFAGSTVAERLADAGASVLVVDKREHIAGNAYDEFDSNGVLVHRYGPHFFHTNAKPVVDHLSRFTEWRPYENRVLSYVDGRLLPFPINLDTINELYGWSLSSREMVEFLASARQPRAPLRTSEDVILNSVGPDLCDLFFRGYSRKHWGLDLSELAASVAARIPVRTNRDDRYFTDTYQMIPLHGYTRMFTNMLDHRNITVELGTDFSAVKGRGHDHVVFTGPIDAYFDYRYGRLPYRSLRFEHEHHSHMAQFQPAAVVNYPNDFEFTRITEFRHATGQTHEGTSIVREYPTASGIPCYPIPRARNEELYRRYRALAKSLPDVTFVGRLAQYRYYNMDQVTASALKAARHIVDRYHLEESKATINLPSPHPPAAARPVSRQRG